MRDQGLYLFGKIESGTITDSFKVTMVPSKKTFEITSIQNAKDQRVKYAKAGENVKLKVKGLEDNDVGRGYMICNIDNFSLVCHEFQARITIMELPEHKPIFTEGYMCILHMHAAVEEVHVSKVEAIFDEKGNATKTTFLRSGTKGIVKIFCKHYLCLEKFETLNNLGRFTLRDEGITIASGEVLKVKPAQVSTEQKERIEEAKDQSVTL